MEQPTANDFVQVTLNLAQVELLHGSVHVAAQDKKLPTPLANALYDLEDFLGHILESPRSFPVTGQMARSLKVRFRRLKGPRERPKPMGREARRKRRKEAHRERRRTRAADALAFNAARAEREAEDRRASKPRLRDRVLGRGSGGS